MLKGFQLTECALLSEQRLSVMLQRGLFNAAACRGYGLKTEPERFHC